jgi:photosystem I P700 chlorophyll a apoprotein A2
MATKLFPKFSQGLAQDPTTRRIWFGLAVAHDFESHDGMTEENLYQKIFASHFGQLAIIFLWSAARSLESWYVKTMQEGGKVVA